MNKQELEYVKEYINKVAFDCDDCYLCGFSRDCTVDTNPCDIVVKLLTQLLDEKKTKWVDIDENT